MTVQLAVEYAASIRCNDLLAYGVNIAIVLSCYRAIVLSCYRAIEIGVREKGFMLKECGLCGEGKEAVEFHADNGREDGLQRYCKVCRVKYNREWQRAHRAKILARRARSAMEEA